MKHAPLLLLCLFFCFLTVLHAQTNTAESIINKTVSKTQMIERQSRIVERTFSDVFFDDTSRINVNRTLVYNLYKGDVYTFTAFAPPDMVADINVLIITSDDNSDIVASDHMYGSDISFSYTPTVSGQYLIAVSCAYKSGNTDPARFGMIIDRRY